MDQTDLKPILADLSSDISKLESALQPLLDTPLPTIASKLPLLDKAKLHVLTTYTVESLLFSSLRLSGVDAKQHPVFRELARTRQYFEKVKRAEEGPAKRTVAVDKAAAGRFIQHGLAGNERFNKESAAKEAKQRKSAKRKREVVEDVEGKDKGDEAGGVDTISTDATEAAQGLQLSETTRESGKKAKKAKKKHHKHSQPPKSGHEAFQALMQGPKGQR